MKLKYRDSILLCMIFMLIVFGALFSRADTTVRPAAVVESGQTYYGISPVISGDVSNVTVYGAPGADGMEGDYKVSFTANGESDRISGLTYYGGAESGDVKGSVETEINVSGAVEYNYDDDHYASRINGGSAEGSITGNVLLNIKKLRLAENLSSYLDITGVSSIGTDDWRWNSLGAKRTTVNGDSTINIDDLTAPSSGSGIVIIYGGGLIDGSYMSGDVYPHNDSKIQITGKSIINVNGDGSDGQKIADAIYGGGQILDSGRISIGESNIFLNGGIIGGVYGGVYGGGDVSGGSGRVSISEIEGDSNITLNGAVLENGMLNDNFCSIYGGGYTNGLSEGTVKSVVKGTARITINSGAVDYIYGGGGGDNATFENSVGAVDITINGDAGLSAIRYGVNAGGEEEYGSTKYPVVSGDAVITVKNVTGSPVSHISFYGQSQGYYNEAWRSVLGKSYLVFSNVKATFAPSDIYYPYISGFDEITIGDASDVSVTSLYNNAKLSIASGSTLRVGYDQSWGSISVSSLDLAGTLSIEGGFVRLGDINKKSDEARIVITSSDCHLDITGDVNGTVRLDVPENFNSYIVSNSGNGTVKFDLYVNGTRKGEVEVGGYEPKVYDVLEIPAGTVFNFVNNIECNKVILAGTLNAGSLLGDYRRMTVSGDFIASGDQACIIVNNENMQLNVKGDSSGRAKLKTAVPGMLMERFGFKGRRIIFDTEIYSGDVSNGNLLDSYVISGSVRGNYWAATASSSSTRILLSGVEYYKVKEGLCDGNLLTGTYNYIWGSIMGGSDRNEPSDGSSLKLIFSGRQSEWSGGWFHGGGRANTTGDTRLVVEGGIGGSGSYFGGGRYSGVSGYSSVELNVSSISGSNVEVFGSSPAEEQSIVYGSSSALVNNSGEGMVRMLSGGALINDMGNGDDADDTSVITDSVSVTLEKAASTG
ncbi:MAG: hypothetical protein Q4D58_00895 [Synergistaceae bacterium]|nr:hypothetical protein [Synergistaceae bacterium]